MPVLNGLEATRQILAANPAAKILILSAHSDDKHVEGVTTVGAVGFLEKEASAHVLTKAIHEIEKGKSFFSAAIARRMANSRCRSLDHYGLPKLGKSRLSSRQMEVLQLVAEGKANKQVAAELGISIKTVEKHRQQVMDKLNIHETAGLTRYALVQGIAEKRVQRGGAQTIKVKSHSTEQKIRILGESDGGENIVEVRKENSASEIEFRRLKRPNGELDVNKAKRMKELGRENTELKKMLADSLLKNRVLRAGITP